MLPSLGTECQCRCGQAPSLERKASAQTPGKIAWRGPHPQCPPAFFRQTQHLPGSWRQPGEKGWRGTKIWNCESGLMQLKWGTRPHPAHTILSGPAVSLLPCGTAVQGPSRLPDLPELDTGVLGCLLIPTRLPDLPTLTACRFTVTGSACGIA